MEVAESVANTTVATNYNTNRQRWFLVWFLALQVIGKALDFYYFRVSRALATMLTELAV